MVDYIMFIFYVFCIGFCCLQCMIPLCKEDMSETDREIEMVEITTAVPMTPRSASRVTHKIILTNDNLIYG